MRPAGVPGGAWRALGASAALWFLCVMTPVLLRNSGIRGVSVLFADIFIASVNCGKILLEATITLTLGGASHQ